MAYFSSDTRIDARDQNAVMDVYSQIKNMFKTSKYYTIIEESPDIYDTSEPRTGGFYQYPQNTCPNFSFIANIPNGSNHVGNISVAYNPSFRLRDTYEWINVYNPVWVIDICILQDDVVKHRSRFLKPIDILIGSSQYLNSWSSWFWFTLSGYSYTATSCIYKNSKEAESHPNFGTPDWGRHPDGVVFFHLSKMLPMSKDDTKPCFLVITGPNMKIYTMGRRIEGAPIGSPIDIDDSFNLLVEGEDIMKTKFLAYSAQNFGTRMDSTLHETNLENYLKNPYLNDDVTSPLASKLMYRDTYGSRGFFDSTLSYISHIGTDIDPGLADRVWVYIVDMNGKECVMVGMYYTVVVIITVYRSIGFFGHALV